MYGIIDGIMDLAFWCDDNISFSNIFKSLNKCFFIYNVLKELFIFFIH